MWQKFAPFVTRKRSNFRVQIPNKIELFNDDVISKQRNDYIVHFLDNFLDEKI